jgi:hypothetical protein
MGPRDNTVEPKALEKGNGDESGNKYILAET